MNRFALIIASLALLAGCATTAPAPTGTVDKPYVSQIKLSRTVGEVGRPFAAEIDYSATRLGTGEVSVSNLPPGLRFDAKKQRIVGVPAGEGFFSVTVAVRRERGPGVHANTVAGRWFTEEFEVAIYQPLEEDGQDSVPEVAGLDF